MNNRILNLNKKKSTRRDFFKVTSALFCSMSIPIFLNAKKINGKKKENFIIVDGWVLKEGDIHDL